MEEQSFVVESELSQDKDALLSLLLEEKGLSISPAEDAIAPRNHTEEPPLSYAQQAQWFLHQLDPNNPFYNICATIEFTGVLEVQALEQSLNTLIARHEILRTKFVTVGDHSRQVINSDINLPSLAVVDLQALSPSAQAAETKRLVKQAAQRPFDLSQRSSQRSSQTPLFRVTLLKLTQTSHVLILVMHHIISDGLSLGVFVRELGLVYSELTAGREVPLSKLPIQYADYALWQRQQLQGERREALLDYWRQQLAGIPPLLELPSDRRRPPVQSFRGDTVSCHIDLALTEQLRALSQASGTTLFTTLLAAFKVLLHRYSGQSDIVVGSLVANRNRLELEGLIGFFANFLALRTQLSEGLTFRDLLAEEKAVTLAAYAHQELPFDVLVEALQPERTLHTNPLFQVVFELQNAPLPATTLPDLTLSPIANLETGTVRSDLELHLWEDTDGIKGGWVYSRDLFDRATIERMLGHFQTLLAGIVANPDQQLANLPLLTSAEQDQRLMVWSQNPIDPAIARPLEPVAQAQAQAQAPNPQVYLLDRALNLVPVGVPGEVYLSQMGLTPTDLAQAELSAEALIPHPFATSGWLYKTGDLACYLPDGQIEWRGRLERQVSVRGFRVGLDDVETVIKRHEQIQQCAVIARDERLNRPPLETRSPASETASETTSEPLTLAITATFTAEPLADTLNFWGETLDSAWRVDFAPYNQVFQQLLDGKSLLSQNRAGINLILVRLEDWIRHADATDEVALASILTQTTAELIQTLQSSSLAPVSHLLCLCPSANPQQAQLIARLEAQIQTELAAVSNVDVLRADEVTAAYPVEQCHDRFADEQGHIPYTTEFFTALGSRIARQIQALHRPPFKVIVLDCDNTLWRGVCGEVGPTGIELTAAHRTLQTFMANQASAGMLLCLCSKNVEADVLAVFEQRQDMPLTLDQVAAYQINWQPKSENLKALAQTLDLGLDSFIFLDDNPVECAEVKAHCPQVLTLQLPSQLEAFPHFLNHVWAFDRLRITEADRRRTKSYQQNRQRQQLQEQSLTLAEFLETLRLQVAIAPMQSQQLDRVAQLTQRTNQFNATTIRRSASEIQALCQRGPSQHEPYTCLTVTVSDRFGNYGLVGVVLFKQTEAALDVDTLLLSCRVLGRGVEHQVLAHLGAIAQAQGIEQIAIPYQATPRNLPVRQFLNQAAQTCQHPSQPSTALSSAPSSAERAGADRETFVFSAAHCQAIHYQPDTTTPNTEVSAVESISEAALSAALSTALSTASVPQAQPNNAQPNNARIEEDIVSHLSTVGQIQQALEQQQEAAQSNTHQPSKSRKQLVAYLVSDDTLDLKQLKSDLKQQLPDYMVPSLMAPIETLPLTANGSVDHPALLASADQLKGEAQFVAPQTPQQSRIAHLFAKVLRLPTNQIGIHDSFFQLGGHSLLAMQLVTRLRETFEVEVPLTVIFASSTVASLEVALEQDLTPDARMPKITPVQRQGTPIPLSYAQERLWFMTQLEGEAGTTYNVLTTLQIQGRLDTDVLQQAMDALVKRHETLRTTFPTVEGAAVQQINPHQRIAIAVLDTARLDISLTDWLQQEAQQPFDLASGPLLRATLLQSSPAEEGPGKGPGKGPEVDQEVSSEAGQDTHTLALTIHHMISDEWSMDVFIYELMTLYEAYRQGQPSPLPALTIQYADYALRQRQWLQGEVLNTQLSYWRQQLIGAPPLLNLPLDYPRQASNTSQGRSFDFSVSKPVAQRLQALSQAQGVTLFMTLLSGFATLLHRYARQEDISIGIPVTHRDRQELEPLIGFFVNNLPVRIQIQPHLTFADLLGQVRQGVLGAHTHSGVAFSQIVDAVCSTRSALHSPLFQACFSLEQTAQKQIDLPDLKCQLLSHPTNTSKFDISLLMKEGEALSGTWEYRTELFKPETIVQLNERYQALLSWLAEHPEAPLETLSFNLPLRVPPLQPMPAADVNADVNADVSADVTVALSAHPQRLWLSESAEANRLDHTQPTDHTISLRLKLSEPLDAKVLEASIQAVVNRHAILRTRSVSAGDAGQPNPLTKVAAVDDTALFSVVEVDPDEGADGSSLLALVIHHSIGDRQTLRLVAEEIAQDYRARQQGQVTTSPPPHLEYQDYIHWQTQFLNANQEQLLFYWRWHLRGHLPALELPEDHSRAAIHSFTPERLPLAIDSALMEKLNAFCQDKQVPISTVLLTGFIATLQRYAQQDEIILGLMDSGRHHPATQTLVGPLANPLVLRQNLQDEPSLSLLLRRVASQLEQVFQHRDMPLGELVKALNPVVDSSRMPLFDVLFELDEEPCRTVSFGAATAAVVETDIGYGKHDLHLYLGQLDGRLEGSAVYNADIYDRFTMTQLLQHFEVMLRALLTEPEQSVQAVGLLSEAQTQQQLGEWNAAAAEVGYPTEQTIHQLFVAQAAQNPGQVAVTFEHTSLTYQQLDHQSNQLAHYLRAQGVGAETLVAVCLERSPEMIVTLLGILKAGGAYIPIDPEYPANRIQFMVTDAKATHVVTTSALREILSTLPHESVCILLDQAQATLRDQPTDALVNHTAANHLAYCLYTSGSTGQPKGVLVEHRNVVRLLINDQQPFAFGTEDVWTLFHSYCFDFSVWEIFGALLHGGRLVIVPAAARKDPAQLAQLLIDQGVTVLNQTPSSFYGLAQSILQSEPASTLALRYVIFGGEAIAPIHLKAWKAHYPNISLINMYGITETTVHVTYKALSWNDIETNNCNIGRAIPTTTTYILDQHMRLLPIGVPGELCVGGEGVSRGYFNRPDLTQAKFVSNPYRPEERLYRSGDLAKFLPSGEIHYLGRMDHQVKVRGFRIELGEIEAVLSSYEPVQQCAVLVREDTPGNKGLVAYVVGDRTLEVSALKSYLKHQLPDYMTPSLVIPLETLPLTANGKVDRKALPAPSDALTRTTDFAAPQTDEEKAIAAIWQDILGVERVGVYDNFFEVGGDSILSIQVIAQAQKIGLTLTPAQLFQQTVEELARDAAVQDAAASVVAQQGQVTGTAPLTPIQQWFLGHDWTNPHHFNQAVLLEVPPDLQVEALQRSVEQLVVHHDALRLRFTEKDGQWHQSHDEEAAATVALETNDLSHLSPEAQAQTLATIAQQQHTSLHLEQGPILRVVLFNLGQQQPHRLLIVLHHLVVDGVSWRILLADLFELYEQISFGETPDLPPKTTAFQDWARQLQTYSNSAQLQSQLAYWTQLPWAAAKPLPVDGSAPATVATVAAAKTASHSLNHAETQQLLKQVPKAYNTQINDALLTALVQVVGRWSEHDTVLIGLEGHGRESLNEPVNLSRTVGWFTSLYPVLLTMASEASVEQVLKGVKEQLREVPQAGIGFGVLRYMSENPEVTAALSALPTPELSFNYLGQVDQGLTLIDDWKLGSKAIEFDLSPVERRPHLLDINAQVIRGCLQVDWTYNPSHHRSETIEHLAEAYITALRALINHCLSPTTGGHTPSDFPLVQFDQAELDDLLKQFG